MTGGHSGIGLETTRVLSKAGAAVVVGARDVEKAKASLAKIGNVDVIPLDLAGCVATTIFELFGSSAT